MSAPPCTAGRSYTARRRGCGGPGGGTPGVSATATAATLLGQALDELPGDEAVRAELGMAPVSPPAPASSSALRLGPHRACGERAERLAGAATATSRLECPGAAITELRTVLDTWPEAGIEPGRLVLEAGLAAMCSILPADLSRRLPSVAVRDPN